MAESFSVGEIALYFREISIHHGTEVVVLEGLKWRQWDDLVTGGEGAGWAYRVKVGGDCMLVAEPHELRKRRPPQDWVKLCNLHDIPREVVHG